MTYLELERYLGDNSDKLEPCYIISGDDDYLVDSTVARFAELVDMYKELNISRLYDALPYNIVGECQTLPFGSNYKLVIAYNTKIKQADCTIIKRYLSDYNPSIILLLVRSTISGNLPSVVINCERLSGAPLVGIIRQRVAYNNASIDNDACTLLANYCDNNLLLIDNEITKLSFYKHGNTIVSSDVEAIVHPSTQYKIFELSEAVVLGDKDRAFRVFGALIDSGEDYIALNGLLYNHFRRLLMCVLAKDDHDLATYLGVKEYAVSIAKRQSKLFGARVLTKICKEFWAVDRGFRAGELALKDTTQRLMLYVLNL